MLHASTVFFHSITSAIVRTLSWAARDTKMSSWSIYILIPTQNSFPYLKQKIYQQFQNHKKSEIFQKCTTFFWNMLEQKPKLFLKGHGESFKIGGVQTRKMLIFKSKYQFFFFMS